MSTPRVGDFTSDDPVRRADACHRAGADPAGALLAERLVDALGDPARSVTRAAAQALLDLGRRGTGVEGLLQQALRGGVPQRRWGAALTLSRLAPPEIGLLPALVDALRSPEGDVRWSAARCLVALGRTQGEVFPVLLGLVRRDERATVRRMAVFALRELAPELPESARALLEASRDANLGVRRAAVSALAGLRDPPLPVATRLAELVEEDPDPGLRSLAGRALEQLRSTSEAR
ncbi:MAG: HEAT repeat domain-containing protein [Myxococcota bacterium]